MTRRSELARALGRWQRAAGPYWMYVCAAPFLQDVPDAKPYRPGRSAYGVVDALAALPPGETYAAFVDRPLTPLLRVTPELNNLGYRVVPIIQRFCVASAVVRSERLAQAFVEAGSVVTEVNAPRGVVFLLDGERLGPTSRRGVSAIEPPTRSAFDNRYEYPLDRFPPQSFLLHEGITAVRWLGGDIIAPDLQVYAQQLVEAGLGSEIVHPDIIRPEIVRLGRG